MATEPFGVFQPAGGGRSFRQENVQTEVLMPGAQAALRAGVDIIAGLLILLCVLILGRWAIWLVIAAVVWSERYQLWADALISTLTGPAATSLEVALWLLQWGWTFTGWLWLRAIIPVTWTLEGELWLQTSQIAPAWPLFFWRAPWLQVPFGPFLRLIALLVCAAPLASVRPLRDRLQWSLWEFTPYGPINAAEMGIDPHQWRTAQPVQPETPAQPGHGIIIERVDYRPHTQIIANGVAMSNASGRSALRVDMSWVTKQQWLQTAEVLLVKHESFSENALGRGLVFPTYGPEDPQTGRKLGFRYFREQCEEAGLIEKRGRHENAGCQLTEAGHNFLKRMLEEDGKTVTAVFEPLDEVDFEEDSDGEAG